MAKAKRFLDIFVSTFFIVLMSPLFIIIIVSIWLEDGSPVFYCQQRVGLNGEIFNLFKFRSMYLNNIPVAELGQVNGNNKLVTRVGRVIRRLKIDEIPQLINVLKGDMALVGPRPTVPEQVEKYDNYQKKRLEVKPGMTGWAQINGNTCLTWDSRVLLDRWYVNNWSIWLDFIILAKTILVVIRGEKINIAALEEAAACEDSNSRSCI